MRKEKEKELLEQERRGISEVGKRIKKLESKKGLLEKGYQARYIGHKISERKKLKKFEGKKSEKKKLKEEMPKKKEKKLLGQDKGMTGEIEKEIKKLESKKSLLERGYKAGYIDEKSYQVDLKKIEKIISRLRKKFGGKSL